MKSILTLLSILSFLSAIAEAEACKFEKLKIQTAPSADVDITGDISLRIEGGKGKSHQFDGPVSVMDGKKLVCKFEGGIFSDFYASDSKMRLLTQEFSGDCGTFRVIDLKNCKIHSETGHYCGDAVVESENKIVNHAYCEPLNASGSLGSCSTAHVFYFADDCSIGLDKTASRELTKKDIGIDLPFDSVYVVSGIHTGQAKVVKKGR